MAWTENKFRPALSGKQLNHLQRIKGTTGSWPQNDAEEIDAEKMEKGKPWPKKRGPKRFAGHPELLALYR